MKGYKTKKDLTEFEKRVNGYFASCDAFNREEKKAVKPYTLSGLLCYLGITQSELDSLCENRKLKKIINSAKLRIEAYIEENALNGKLSSTAAINSLKCNFGWSDKKPEEDNTGGFSVVLEGEADELSE